MWNGYLIAGCLCSIIGSVIDNWGMNLQKLAHKNIKGRAQTELTVTSSPRDSGIATSFEQAKHVKESDQSSRRKQLYSKVEEEDTERSSHSTSERHEEEEEGEEVVENYTCTVAWLFGFSIYIIGQILNFISLSMIDQPTQSILSSFALFSNLLFAKHYFNENFSKSDLLGLLNISAGASLFVIYFTHKKQNYTIQQLEKHFYQKEMLCLIVFLAAVIGFCMLYVSTFSENTLRQLNRLPLISGLLTWFMRNSGERGHFSSDFSALAYAIIAAIMGGCTVTFSKIVSVILPDLLSLYKTGSKVVDQHGLEDDAVRNEKAVQELSSETEFTIFSLRFVVVILCIWVFLLVTSVHALNVGLRNSPALVMIPVFYVLSNMTSIFVGTIYFEEYETFESVKATTICLLGLVMTLSGIFMLSKRVAKAKSSDMPTYRVHLGSINSVFSTA